MFIVKEIKTAAYLFASILFILSLEVYLTRIGKTWSVLRIIGMIVAIIATVLGKVLPTMFILLQLLLASGNWLNVGL